MRIAFVAALLLATEPALAQTPDISRERRVATIDEPRDRMALWDPAAHEQTRLAAQLRPRPGPP
jgi:hypothetical protein